MRMTELNTNARKYRFMPLRKKLFLILVLALSFVPIFQATHALTHVEHIDAIGTAYTGNHQAEAETDVDIDRTCLDCLALTGLSVILSAPSFFSFDQKTPQPLLRKKSARILVNFSSPYLTRAPPQA